MKNDVQVITDAPERRVFSLSSRVKNMMNPDTRVKLCRALAPHYLDVVSGEVRKVEIGEDVYILQPSRNNPDKVYVSVPG